MAQTLQQTITYRDQEIINRKKAENSLESLNKDLESTIHQLTDVNRQLQEFASIAAHELKAPLRAIGTLASMMAEDYHDRLDEEGRKNLGILAGRARRMSNFIDSLVMYSKLGRAIEKNRKVNLNDILKEVIKQLHIAQKDVELTIPDHLPLVIGEKTHMTQVFRELLDNALKYMDKPKGQVNIGCVEEDGFWKFSVADNGPGIDQRYFGKIFKIFQILSIRDDHESTGIGLAVVKKIVEMYGGSVWVQSKVGNGSTFFFTLPKQEVEVKDVELEASIASLR
jgi:signal transduction histidine kinase